MAQVLALEDVIKLTFRQAVEVLKEHREIPVPSRSAGRQLVKCAKHYGTWCKIIASESIVTVELCGKCPRCDGKGFIEAYRHIHGGRCAKCDGSGNL